MYEQYYCAFLHSCEELWSLLMTGWNWYVYKIYTYWWLSVFVVGFGLLFLAWKRIRRTIKVIEGEKVHEIMRRMK